MTAAARIQAALHAAFDLPPPSVPPVPAGPARFPAIFAAPSRPTTLNPLRLAIGGTVTTAPKR